MENEWVTVEYSGRQKFFHIDFYEVTLQRNMRTYMQNKSNDYQILGIFPTWEKASDYIKKLKKIKSENEQIKVDNFN